MPQLEGGDIDSVTEKAKTTSSKIKKYIENGYQVLSIVPSCTLMLKYEWPLILPENKDVKKLSRNTKDICEFLVEKLNEQKNSKLLKPIPEDDTITLHISCHSRAQNMGQKASELLKLVPEIKLDVIERCSGHGGSWGVKKNNFKMAIKVGKPVARKAIQNENKYLISECPLAAPHIKQGMDKIDKTKKVNVLSHPLEILAKSMNIKLTQEKMKKFEITEKDVVDIDKYINERAKIKIEISKKKKNFEESLLALLQHFILSVMKQ